MLLLLSMTMSSRLQATYYRVHGGILLEGMGNRLQVAYGATRDRLYADAVTDCLWTRRVAQCSAPSCSSGVTDCTQIMRLITGGRLCSNVMPRPSMLVRASG